MAGKLTIPAILAAAMLAAGTVWASEIEEVVVTADFYDQSIMRKAGSISVIDSADVVQGAALHLEHILNLAPNVNWSAGGARSKFLQIRGIGDLEQFQDPKYYPAVGINVDDLELGDVAGSAMLFDLEQVEVLRGPQGTRFGATGVAGTVNIRTADPTDHYESIVSAGLGNANAWNLGAVLSGPLSERSRARLSVQQNSSDGHIRNSFLQRDDTAGHDEFSVRAKLHWDGLENGHYELAAVYFDGDNGYDAWSFDNPRETKTDQPGKDAQRTRALSVKGEWSLPAGTELEALLNHNSTDLDYGYDADWVSAEFCVRDPACLPGDTDTATETFLRDRAVTTAELRFLSSGEDLSAGGSGLVAGVFARRSRERLNYAYRSAWFGDFGSRSHYTTERLAAYARHQWAVNQRWQLTTGLRYEHFTDRYRDTNEFLSGRSDDLWNAEVSAARLLGPKKLVYATVSRGEKPGGVNTSASSNHAWMSPDFRAFTADKLEFRAERMTNKEVGFKASLADDRLSVRAALFHTDREHAQLESWMWDGNAGLWIGYLDSTSDAESYGVELELDFEASEHIRLFGALGWLQTQVDAIEVFDLDRYEFTTRSQRNQAKSPEYQFAVGASMRLSESLSARVEVQGKDKHYFGYYHDGQLPPFEILNANLEYRTGALSFNLWARNLTDEYYGVHGLYFGADPRNGWANETYQQAGAPRTWGVNVRYRY